MATYLTPGVYIEEVSGNTRSISGVSMDAAVFIGQTRQADTQDAYTPVTSYTEFARRFSKPAIGIRSLRKTGTDYLAYAVQGFFDNGGKKLYVLRLEKAALAGYLQALQQVDNFADAALLAMPGYSTLPAPEYARLNQVLVRHAETWRKRMILLEPPPGASQATLLDIRRAIDSRYAALYAPWLKLHDPSLRRDVLVPPGGHLAGIYAHTEATRGIHKSPANVELQGIRGFERTISDTEQSTLNPQGVNALRTLRGRHLVWGARTTSNDPEWRYVAVQRFAMFVEQSLQQGLQWAVFEPNEEPLWAQVRLSVSNFMHTQWRNGALQGAKAEEAFFVRVDRSTMTQSDIEAGRLILQVGFAPLKPAEFVILRLVFNITTP